MNITAGGALESDRSTQPSEREASPFTVRTAGRTDRGRVRETNEDQLLVTPPVAVERHDAPAAPIETQLLAVADGMGGHAGGEMASLIAVRTVSSTLLPVVEWLPAVTCSEDTFEASVLAELRAAFEEAHENVRDEAERRPELTGMGTTLTLAYRHGGRLFVAHAGDSRCYLLRDGELFQITRDHTVVNELVRRGFLQSVAEANASIRNVLTNALGNVHEGVKVETHRIHLHPGDTVLLCTDGLTGMVSDEGIRDVLSVYSDPDEAGRRLIDAANEAGGHDNITVVVARCE